MDNMEHTKTPLYVTFLISNLYGLLSTTVKTSKVMGKNFFVLNYKRQNPRMQKGSLAPQTPMKHYSKWRAQQFLSRCMHLEKTNFSFEKMQEKTRRLNKQSVFYMPIQKH